MAEIYTASVIVLVIFLVVCSCEATSQRHVCIHDSLDHQLVEGVRPSTSRGADRQPVKRQARQPIRFYPHYDSSVTQNSNEEKRKTIQEVVPAVIKYFSSVLSVNPSPSPLLLNRICVGGKSFDPDPATGEDVRRCFSQCERPPLCGTVTIPEEHLRRCVECSQSESQCQLGNPSQDGPGVEDTDYILYISARDCPSPSTLAFAAACQIESELERPIAGFINFCSNNLGTTTRDFLFRVAQHEVYHALGFSSSLMSRWRDSTGTPRVPENQRDQPLPDSVVRNVEYTDWNTIAGPVSHSVSLLVTEAVVREGRAYFGCQDLEGVELENQGGNGTALEHWEKRILGNEAMTGIFDFNPTFSRLTLAVLEDSGWYSVNYAMAESLLWGRNKGCGFIRNGCGDMLDEEPFCGLNIRAKTFGCTLDRGSKAICNLGTLGNDVDPDFRYLSGNSGGTLEIADYCPYFRGVSTGNCTDPQNQPATSTTGSFFGETYGPGSVCYRQGRTWSRTTDSGTSSLTQFGGGCYETRCPPNGAMSINIHGAWFECDCEGQELVVEVAVCDNVFQGSVICSSCSSVCYGNCTSPEPEACPGTVKNFQRVTVDTNCDAAPPTLSSSPPSNIVSLTLTALLLTLTYILH